MILAPCYVINLDRSPDRWERLSKDMAGIAELHRVEAVDGSSLSYDETKHFHDEMRAAILRDRAERPESEWVLGHATSAGSSTESRFRAGWPRYANVYGCYLSHAKAIRQALEDGAERFIILEDDAVPRRDLIEATPTPDEDAIYVWGGCIPMSATRPDAMRYWKGMPWTESPWIKVDNTPKGLRRRYGAQAYEMTAVVGERYLEIYESVLAPADCAWHYAMLEIPTYRLNPCAFGQNKDYEPSTIGRDRPGPPVERWIREGLRPEDIELITDDYRDKRLWLH